MKILITALLLFSSICCFSQVEEPEFGAVNVSTEKHQGKPIVIFSQQGKQYFLNIKTDKFKGNYVLKFLGGHTNMGITQSTYEVYDFKKNKLDFKVSHAIGNTLNKPIHTLTLLNQGSNDVEVHLTALQ